MQLPVAEMAAIRGLSEWRIVSEERVGLEGGCDPKEVLKAASGDVVVVVHARSEDLIIDLLGSHSWAQGFLLLLGTGPQLARRPLELLDWFSWTKVRYVDLEFVPPRLVEAGAGSFHLEGGLGLIGISQLHQSLPRRPSAAPVARLLPDLRSPAIPERIAAAEVKAARRRLREVEKQRDVALKNLARAERVISRMESSLSWRFTAPLRELRRR